ncbi:ATP-dependent DNA helicase RecG [Patescibacteria group bacterium]
MTPTDLTEKHFRLKSEQKKALTKLGITTVQDLLYHFPTRYNHISEIKNIADLREHDEAVVYGKVLNTKMSKAYRTKIPIGEVTIEDKTGKIKATWFNQPYAAKMLKKDQFVKLAGKVTKQKSGTLYLANPEFEQTKELPIDVGDSIFKKDNSDESEIYAYAVYPERRGITSRWFYHAIQKIIAHKIPEQLKDPIPSEILKKYNLPSLQTALVWIHMPKNDADAQAARKRFAFEEIFFIQLTRQIARKEYKSNPSYIINAQENDKKEFLDRFDFPLTNAQDNAINQILNDFSKNEPMSRLLEGDVGSGKTAVAAATAYAVISTRPNGQDFGNLQVAYMAPTEILATQLYESFIEYFKHLPIQIGLITGSGCRKFPSKNDPSTWTKISRAQLLKWVANGEIPILIGTHALIQKTVEFKDLAYVIIDEQHRFGTNQRAKLPQKDKRIPHLLSMTATPIPRTLALTIYGDLDLTILDEMPAGRKKVITEIVPPTKREKRYDEIKKEMDAGRQVYVICARIDEPDPEKESALRLKSVKAEAERLKEKVFKDKNIEILHGKMTPKEKDEVMADYANGEIDILVATSVVEVGVNVPNATVIIIEGAERFGLAQLHQLRGRVLRSTHQSYCYLFTSDNSNSKQALQRLEALSKAKNGFELSELDLQLRGAGELAGNKQWGVSDIGMEAIKNIKMVEAARTEAQKLLGEDPELIGHPKIAEQLKTRNTEIHLE